MPGSLTLQVVPSPWARSSQHVQGRSDLDASRWGYDSRFSSSDVIHKHSIFKEAEHEAALDGLETTIHEAVAAILRRVLQAQWGPIDTQLAVPLTPAA